MNHELTIQILLHIFQFVLFVSLKGMIPNNFLSPKREGRDGKLLTRRVTHSKVDSNTVPCEKMIELHPAPHDSLR